MQEEIFVKKTLVKTGTSNNKREGGISSFWSTGLNKGRKKLTEKQKRLWGLQLFLLRFLVLAIPLYLVLTFGIDMWPVQLEVARESAWVIGLLGYNPAMYGAGVLADSSGSAPFFFVISPDCTGWKSMLFFVALLFAVPKRPWKSRVAGVVAGIAILWAINIFRVAAVVLIYSSLGLGAAMAVHDYLWQIGMGLAALLIWIAWLKLSK